MSETFEENKIMQENQTNESEVHAINDDIEIRNKMTVSLYSGSDDSPVKTPAKSSLLLGAGETKLEGWLKLAGFGFLRTVKQVWFVYGEDTGKLYYYVQPQDVMPAGEIDLRCSSFTYDASNSDKEGVFEIRSGGKTYSIDALEREHKLNWLEALQKKRRAFSLKQAELAQDLFTGKKKPFNVGGLLGQASEDSDEVSIQSIESLKTEAESMVSTIHFIAGDKEKLENDSASALCGDCFVVTGRPPPPSSLPLVNNFATQWHDDCDQSSFGSKSSETPSISSDCHNESEHADISAYLPDECKTASNPKDSSQTLPAVKSKQLPSDGSQSLVTSPLSPLSTNAAIGKLKFMSLLRNNFKIVKDTVKEKKMNISVKYQALTSPENAVNISSCCFMCRELGDELLCVKEKLKTTLELLAIDRENAGLLQKEMDIMRAVLNTRKEYEGKSEDDIIQVLHLKEKHITELETSVNALLDEKNVLALNQRQSDNELKNLRDQISMFQQTLAIKDDMIMSLTNTNQELIDSNSNDLTDEAESTELCFPFPNGSTSVAVDRKELERLVDMCKAYEDQNKFLTKEILELNTLRQNDEAREKILKMHFDSLEAKCRHVNSKYLYLLNEVQAPVRGGEENNNQDIVKQLLQDALESEPQDDDDESRRNFSSFQGREYDCFGFPKFGHEDGNALVTRANVLQRQSLEIEYQIRNADEEISKLNKWENFMVGLSPNKQLIRSSDLKILLRQGIPHQFRESIWKGCINLYVRSKRAKHGEKYYKCLQERANNNKSNPAIKQIEIDLLRTLPNNKYFDKIDSPGIRKLRKILLCFSIHNPLIGYCQGINRLAAIALLFLGEEDAFWCLVVVTEHLMPRDYYTVSLAAAQADQRVLKDLVQEKCPKLHTHLEANDVDLSFFTFGWFLTVFVDGVLPELFLRVWDVFLYEGSKVLFRFALAFLKYGEDEILKQSNNLAINRCMRTLGVTITDVRRIYTIAFSELNPFPMRSISNKRNYHLQQVKLELEDLKKMRRELRSSQEEVEPGQNRQNDLSEDDLDDDEQ